MTVILWTGLFSLLLITIAQVIWANRFVALYAQPTAVVDESTGPRVGVILALRGADPFLEECLQGLMTQNYANHEVRIVVDSEFDAAFSVVRKYQEMLNAQHVAIEVLDVNCSSCSLKNLALVQGIEGCSASCEIFVWLDSDTVPGPNWLSCMIAPLSDPCVGATSGIRWYAPQARTVSNLARHIWNAAAMLQMVTYGIGWGGSFAIRRSVYDGGQLFDRWMTSMTEDTVASDVVLKMGLKLNFVAEATMVNQESASLKWCINFVTRQLQLLRFYHHAWIHVLAGGLFAGAVVSLLIASSLVSLSRGLLAGPALTAFALFGSVWCAAWLMKRSERVIASARGLLPQTLENSYPSLLLSIPVALMIYVTALIRSYLLKEVCWRGIRYDLKSGSAPLRRNYYPYTVSTETRVKSFGHSL